MIKFQGNKKDDRPESAIKFKTELPKQEPKEDSGNHESLEYMESPRIRDGTSGHVLLEEDDRDESAPHDSQLELERLFDDLVSTNFDLRDVVIKKPLKGELDLSFLKNHRNRIQRIEFAPDGRITKLSHLPPTLTVLVCPQNRLKAIEHLPPTLEELRVPNNNLGPSLDLEKTPKLRILDVNHNQLISLDTVPSEIEELYLDNNPDLAVLDLLGLSKLSCLHCNENRNLTIKNFPSNKDQLKDYQGSITIYALDSKQRGGATKDEENENENIERPRTKKLPSYEQALLSFFEYKSQYDMNVKRWTARQKKRKEKSKGKSKQKFPPCIRCQANVGMTFHKDESTYLAHCGIGKNKSNCSFEIELRNENRLQSRLDQTDEISRKFETIKDEIFQIKMDIIFGYDDTTLATKRFVDALKRFVAIQKEYEHAKESYEELRGWSPKQIYEKEQHIRAIASIKQTYQEILDKYKNDPLNHGLLHDAMETYLEELRPEVKSLRELQYPTMEMVKLPILPSDPFLGKEWAGKLFQTSYTLAMLEATALDWEGNGDGNDNDDDQIRRQNIEPPKVVKFVL